MHDLKDSKCQAVRFACMPENVLEDSTGRVLAQLLLSQ